MNKFFARPSLFCAVFLTTNILAAPFLSTPAMADDHEKHAKEVKQLKEKLEKAKKETQTERQQAVNAAAKLKAERLEAIAEADALRKKLASVRSVVGGGENKKAAPPSKSEAELEKEKSQLATQLKLSESRIKSLQTQLRNYQSGNTQKKQADKRVVRLSQDLSDLKKKQADLTEGFTLLHEEQEKKIKKLEEQVAQLTEQLADAKAKSEAKTEQAKPKKKDAGKGGESAPAKKE